MKTFKILLKEIKEENEWGYTSKDAVKLGEVAFPFKGKLEEEEISLKKGDKVYFQYGNPANLDGVDYILIGTNSLVCIK